ncbi:hypothetical protein HGO38_26875 [Rhizobium sp. CG5]|uniref:hypothetical protein n=1 Tax=Rhizobium sp. CG5 TaxID=2726076 RepID=UPI0020345122|nr:hypothetical protein [Rhizobium sp. CG5]MCM2477080.1 hypothetical protein [Rhizobium sp. CG5]
MSFLFKSRAAEPPAMTLEGILGPNSRLDEAEAIAITRPDALAVSADGALLISSGSSVWSADRWGDMPSPWIVLDHPVTALAVSPGGLVAVGLENGEVRIHNRQGQSLLWAAPATADAGCACDCLFLSEDEIAVVRNGYTCANEALAMAPWDAARTGSVTAQTRDGATRVISRNLSCPMGICRDESGGLIVTELDTTRAIDTSGRVLRGGFPAYLGRLRKTPQGYLLACLSRRDPLIEFLRTEHGFVDEMKATIDPRHWISPRASPEFSHDFPIELGATRLFGEIKPWAPSFSYGLLITLDETLMPTGSLQSRANGRRHAISDAVIWNGDVIAVSQASGEILNLGPLT